MWPAHATPGTGKGVVHEQESQVMHVAFFFNSPQNFRGRDYSSTSFTVKWEQV